MGQPSTDIWGRLSDLLTVLASHLAEYGLSAALQKQIASWLDDDGCNYSADLQTVRRYATEGGIPNVLKPERESSFRRRLSDVFDSLEKLRSGRFVGTAKEIANTVSLLRYLATVIPEEARDLCRPELPPGWLGNAPGKCINTLDDIRGYAITELKMARVSADAFVSVELHRQAYVESHCRHATQNIGIWLTWRNIHRRPVWFTTPPTGADRELEAWIDWLENLGESIRKTPIPTLGELSQQTHSAQKSVHEAEEASLPFRERRNALLRAWEQFSVEYEGVPFDNDLASWKSYAERLAPRIVRFARAIVEAGFVTDVHQARWETPQEKRAAATILKGMDQGTNDLSLDLLSSFADWSLPRFAAGTARPDAWTVVFNSDVVINRILAHDHQLPKEGQHGASESTPVEPKSAMAGLVITEPEKPKSAIDAPAEGDAQDHAEIPLDDVAMLSPADLATRFGVDSERLRKRLERFRQSNDRGWIEVANRRQNEPQFLYQVSAVRHLIADLLSGGTSSERPAE